MPQIFNPPLPPNVANPGSLGRLNRPPSVDDNATFAYSATTDVWQYARKLYSPVAAPDTNSAVWQELASTGGPTGGLVDIATGDGGTCIAAYGLYAVKASFTGACFDYSATVNAGTVTGTISIVAGGELDMAAMGALFSSVDAGTKVVITKWYDQSGGTAHATSVAANGLYVEWDESLQSYCLTGDLNNTNNKRLLIPAGVTGLNTRAYSMHYIGRGQNTEGNFAPVLGCLGDQAGVLNIHMPDASGSGGLAWYPTVSIWQSGQNFRTPTATAAPLECGPCIVQYLPSASNTVMWVNENSATNGTAPTNATLTAGGEIGGYVGSTAQYPGMRYVAIIITSTVMTAATALKIRYATYRRFNIKPQAKDNVVFIGDSRFAGTVSSGTNTRETVAMAVQARLKYPARVINCGNGGFSNLSWQAESPTKLTNIALLYKAGRRNVAIIWLGVNDFLVDAATPATSFSRLTANIATIKAQGWYVIVMQEAATTTNTNGAIANMVALRALIAAGPTGADEVLDMTVYTPYTAASNATFWPDGLHPAAGTIQMIASKIAERVDNQLALGQAI